MKLEDALMLTSSPKTNTSCDVDIEKIEVALNKHCRRHFQALVEALSGLVNEASTGEQNLNQIGLHQMIQNSMKVLSRATEVKF